MNKAASSTVTDENPWTDREDLAILEIYGDSTGKKNVKQWVKMLNDQMSRIRTTKFLPQLPGRTENEFMSRVKHLQEEGPTHKELEKKLWDDMHPNEEYMDKEEETPKKKRKTQE